MSWEHVQRGFLHVDAYCLPLLLHNEQNVSSWQPDQKRCSCWCQIWNSLKSQPQRFPWEFSQQNLTSSFIKPTDGPVTVIIFTPSSTREARAGMNSHADQTAPPSLCLACPAQQLKIQSALWNKFNVHSLNIWHRLKGFSHGMIEWSWRVPGWYEKLRAA